MKKLIIPILLLAALLAPSCIPSTPDSTDSTGGQPEQIEIVKTITPGTLDIHKYHISEFSYCGRRYLLVEAPGRSDFEIVPIF